jgi:hypothetical protein
MPFSMCVVSATGCSLHEGVVFRVSMLYVRYDDFRVMSVPHTILRFARLSVTLWLAVAYGTCAITRSPKAYRRWFAADTGVP